AEGWVLTEKVYNADGTLASSETDSYDNDGQPTLMIDGDGHKTDYRYDAVGHRTAQTDGANSSNPVNSSAAYDGDGNLTWSQDGAGNVTSDTYDAEGHLLSEMLYAPGSSTPDSTTSNQYDLAGNLTWSQDGDGYQTRYGNDAENRQTSVTEGASSAHPIT